MKSLLNRLLSFIISQKMKIFPNIQFDSPAVQYVKSVLQSSGRKKFIVTKNGLKMFLDEKDSLRLSIFKTYEPVATSYVVDLLQEGDKVIDVGANIGYYSLLCAKLVGNSGKIISYEPAKANFEILQKNVEINDLQNVQAVRAAVSNESTTLKLYKSPDNFGDHRIYQNGRRSDFELVPAVVLDNVWAQLKGIKLIKMDIQGAEPLALYGMREIINNADRLSIITEYMPEAIRELGEDPIQFLQRLSEFNLNCYIINDMAFDLQPTSFESLITKTENNEIVEINLVFEKPTTN